MHGVSLRSAVFLSLLIILYSAGEVRAQGASQQSLKQLIEAARKEGQLNWYPVSSSGK